MHVSWKWLAVKRNGLNIWDSGALAERIWDTVGLLYSTSFWYYMYLVYLSLLSKVRMAFNSKTASYRARQVEICDS